ncbi:uncharacterized protein pdzph1 [Synchiropus splendidus]|uniref:uncharacterized protein pdzph1 n=1 Tax=Synchiropus splendidus TaxID=270530 RepID=UPI00237EE418|nr:uncharacterized protein pdzph1 [Synchiropus splendidus]XP_053710784.1 uncharacterized protein pdzph1 [Synchiropus splendidus]
MSKRGRRRSSRRRKSSSSSKQSVTPNIFQKQNKYCNGSYKDYVIEKGEADGLRKEIVQSESEDDEKFNDAPPKEKRFKQDYNSNKNGTTTRDRQTEIKIVTSLSADGNKDSIQNILFQQPRENPTVTAPVANMTISCSGSFLRLEIQQHHTSSFNTTIHFINEKSDDPMETPNNDNTSSKYTSTICSSRGQASAYDQMKVFQCHFDHGQPARADCTYAEDPSDLSTERRSQLPNSFSIDLFENIPPPQEFADTDDHLGALAHEMSQCSIRSWSPVDSQDLTAQLTPNINSVKECMQSELVKEKEESSLFDQTLEFEDYEPRVIRPSMSTNRSSFTKDFINCQKRKSWIRNNSIATFEHRISSLPRKRRQTFPRLSKSPSSMTDEFLMPNNESFTSLNMCLLPLQTERLGRIGPSDDRLSAGMDVYPSVPAPSGHYDRKHSTPCGSSEDASQGRCGQDIKEDPDDHDVVDSGFEQDISSPGQCHRKPLAIQVTPPSCNGSEELIAPDQTLGQRMRGDTSQQEKTENRKSSVVTIVVGSFEQRTLKTDGTSLEEPSLQSNNRVSQWRDEVRHEPRVESTGFSALTLPQLNEVKNDVHLEAKGRCSSDAETHSRLERCQTAEEIPVSADATRKQILSRSYSEAKEHLTPDGSVTDSWAKRRMLFKESKQWSSAGGSSITSDITEESVSEDTRSLDVTLGDGDDRRFYTETFHSAAWVYQGDEVVLGAGAPGLNNRTRPISIRERTVRINKGTGEYPWGFRIQFSKPILVTEVDTNGAAEEAGLMVGDYVLAVNGTDVTSVAHTEAADMARQGPDVLTLTIGSDIARGPNTPRPACRGYLHKRTQSGLIKGWRKRWFVLTHDCCLYYYRHKRDEGKGRALAAIRLEGAEVGADHSLGKPFVLRCRPLSGCRVYYFCGTSNQEIKRWLEAMERAVHPITQNHVWVDVTKHNSNLPPLAVKNPDCLGLLHKMDKTKDVWIQYYCILKDGCLYMYSGIRSTHALGGIYLQGYQVREQSFGSKKSTIELKPPSDEFKSFNLCAENPSENKRWIVAMKASIKKWLPLHQALQDYMNRVPEETRM